VTEPLSKKHKPDPCSFIIFGATGDLTHRLVMPALYNLAASDLLPEKFCVVGIARKGTSNDEMRESLLGGLKKYKTRPVDDTIAKRLLECVTSIEADPIRLRSMRWPNDCTSSKPIAPPAVTACFTWRRRRRRLRRSRNNSAAPAC
jgi:hypothetical protein